MFHKQLNNEEGTVQITCYVNTPKNELKKYDS